MDRPPYLRPVDAADEQETPTSLVSKVIHGIRTMIRSEGLRVGDPLPSEGAIGEQLGVSRAVVREAYRSMSALRLIDVGNGRRARVAAVDDEVLALVMDHGVQTDQVSIQQILDVRRTIEMRTVGLAALRRTEREAREIVALAAAMRADFLDTDKVMEHDIAFHETIARASRNPMFALLVGSFHVVTRQTWRIGWAARETDAERYDSVAGHEAIAAAIQAGNRPEAEAQMAAHFDNTVKVLLASGIN
ncbi:MAG TPA: FadR/GntR family transcriptional regulator [Devosia sp.]|jgi:DNA-binding FadR family transcriptional regulator|uniref:FadR/GntR family transcriptional regulator n=1 Tax=Devosia sp. TaxID=1871048 RepID=UPI002DDD2DAD|nr:FadR/GntR family transcriptional regulator [Devosia sp.]HEV2514243.1 FadR/GntR family transcriptional regulator [Devosia sp.]